MLDKNSKGYQTAIGRIKEWQKRSYVNISLNLEELGLTELPKEIGELKNLQRLSLDNNQLSELPKEIGELKNLQELTLANNPKLNIPQEIVGKSSEPQTILNYYFENIYQVKVEDK